MLNLSIFLCLIDLTLALALTFFERNTLTLNVYKYDRDNPKGLDIIIEHTRAAHQF